jgi:aerobic carbon-monoxide dehydrogenase medium subunit
MIPQNFEYTRPNSLNDALALLADDNAKALAGGMSLIPLMKLRLAAPEKLVDLARIPELNYIRETGGELHIGATTTHYAIESSAAVRARCPLLADTASAIGDAQVRNRGTIGGSIAHADPAADYPAALLALEARAVLAGKGGERTVALSDFFVDTFTTALEPGEIVREVIVPCQDPDEGSSYQKLVQPASGFAIVGIAARVKRSGGKIVKARLGVTGLAAKAYRAANVERAIEGTPGMPQDVQQAAAVIAEGVDANSDLHASAEYRKHLAFVYATRALISALARIA